MFRVGGRVNLLSRPPRTGKTLFGDAVLALHDWQGKDVPLPPFSWAGRNRAEAIRRGAHQHYVIQLDFAGTASMWNWDTAEGNADFGALVVDQLRLVEQRYGLPPTLRDDMRPANALRKLGMAIESHHRARHQEMPELPETPRVRLPRRTVPPPAPLMARAPDSCARGRVGPDDPRPLSQQAVGRAVRDASRRAAAV